MQPQDVAVGKDVLYIRHDPTIPHVQTKIIDKTIKGDRVKLECKNEARMTRVFVSDKAAVGAEATGSDKAAVGAEATDRDKAAVGAVGPAGAASATLGNPASPGETVADADKFLRNEVVVWMSSLEAVGSSLPEALDAALAALGKTPEGLVQAFKVKVPWLPCVNFQAVPKCSKKGTLHISMLSYRPCSYAANGMFVGDAKLLLETRDLLV